MAFLATTERFAPVLDKCRKIYPNPTSYEPVVPTVADGAPFHTSSRYGTIGPHHDVPLARQAAASPAAQHLAAVETPPTSIDSKKNKTPTPWHYTPQVEGQFAHVFTVGDLEAQRRQRRDAARRTAASRHASVARQEDKPQDVQHLALGPGTYEVDKDRNLEPVAEPFSFGKEPRRGILDYTLGAKDLNSDRRRLDKYSKRLSSEQRHRSETALLPLRRAASSSKLTQDASEVAALSKELATSFAELDRSAARLERKLSSPVLRHDAFQRFRAPAGAMEGYRRGPGSYSGPSHTPLTVTPGGVSPSLPVDESQRQELEALLSKNGSLEPHVATKPKKTTTFGLVKHRDMLTSMARAGHLSAVAMEHALGPGVYEPTSTTFIEPTHNVLYKADVSRKTSAKPRHAKSSPSEDREWDEIKLEVIREKWRAMRRGPAIPHG